MKSDNYVFHSSKIGGLKYLEPRESTHQQRWVYATKDLATAALFLGENFDFICQVLTKNGKPIVYEQFEGALEQAYAGKGGYIYKLPAESFEEGQTGWSGEVTSKAKVQIAEEIKIDDALKLIKKLERQDQLRVYLFPEKPQNVPTDKSDIVERAVDWIPKFGEKVLKQVEEYHPDVLHRVISELKALKYEPRDARWVREFKKHS